MQISVYKYWLIVCPNSWSIRTCIAPQNAPGDTKCSGSSRLLVEWGRDVAFPRRSWDPVDNAANPWNCGDVVWTQVGSRQWPFSHVEKLVRNPWWGWNYLETLKWGMIDEEKLSWKPEIWLEKPLSRNSWSLKWVNPKSRNRPKLKTYKKHSH